MYYLTGGVTDKPTGNGGYYSVSVFNNDLLVGTYISTDNFVFAVKLISGTWTYTQLAKESEIDDLNSKMSFSMLHDRDLNAVVDSVPFAIFLQNNSRNATSERHYPVANSAGFMLYSNIETWHLQVFFFFSTSHIYFRAWYDNEGIIPDWREV